MTSRKDPKAEKAVRIKPLAPRLGGRNVRRRDFLNGLLVGASGLAFGGLTEGCGSPPKEEEPPPPTAQFKGDHFEICHSVRDGQMFTLPEVTGDLYDCIVIGGGISGLVAMRKLQRIGVQKLLLLEKEDPVGGVSKRGGEPGKTLHSQAAAYTVFPYNDNLYEVYEDLGVITGYEMDGAPIIDPKYLVKPPSNSDYIDGQWYADSWEEAGIDALPYDAKVKADLKAFRLDMIEWYNYVGADSLLAFDTPTDASTTDANVRALDNMTLSEYCASKNWDPAVSKFFDRYCRSALGTTHDKCSAWAAIGFLGSEYQPVLAQPGGNAHLALGLAEKIGADKIKTNAFVLRAVNVGDEVHVSYMIEGVITTVRAKTVIYAANRYIAKHILPDLVKAGRDEAKSFVFTPYLVAAVYVDKTPEGLGYDNWVQEELFFTDFIIADWAGLADPANAPDRANVLSVYCPLLPPAKREDLLSTSFEAYEEKIITDLEKVVPGITASITGVDLYRWGHAMLATEKGFVFGAARTGARAAEGRISFACADVDGLPAFENAVGAAYLAAEEVAGTLGIPF